MAFLLVVALPTFGLGTNEIKFRIDTSAFADDFFPYGKSVELRVSLENRMKVEAKLKIDWELKIDKKQFATSYSEKKILQVGDKTRVIFARELEQPGFIELL